MEFDIKYSEILRTRFSAVNDEEALKKFNDQFGSVEDGVDVLEIKKV